jgi:hypothetical protein
MESYGLGATAIRTSWSFRSGSLLSEACWKGHLNVWLLNIFKESSALLGIWSGASFSPLKFTRAIPCIRFTA